MSSVIVGLVVVNDGTLSKLAIILEKPLLVLPRLDLLWPVVTRIVVTNQSHVRRSVAILVCHTTLNSVYNLLEVRRRLDFFDHISTKGAKVIALLFARYSSATGSGKGESEFSSRDQESSRATGVARK